MTDTAIDLGELLRTYDADPDHDDWPIIPIRAIGSSGQPVICWWPVKDLGPVPTGHVLIFDDAGRWEFKPIQTN
jgi:hypothetical protein